MLAKRVNVTLDTSSNTLSLDLQRFAPETVLRHFIVLDRHSAHLSDQFEDD
jgi:hypothetical protein